MIRQTLLTTIILFLLLDMVYGETKLYLKPGITAVDNILINDIAAIDSSDSTKHSIENINIDSALYTDGYIDAKEIMSLLKKYTDDRIIIYGNSVRVVSGNQPGELTFVTETPLQAEEVVMRKGDTVDIIIVNNGISITVKGTVIDNARINDEVMVRLESKNKFTSKSIKGRVKARDIVEINI